MIHKRWTSEGRRALFERIQVGLIRDSETIPAAAKVILVSFRTDVENRNAYEILV